MSSNTAMSTAIHSSSMALQATSSAIKDQGPRIHVPTVAGHFARKLFRGIFYSQLTLVSILAIVLTIRGLLLADRHHFQPKKWYPPMLTSLACSGIISLMWQAITYYKTEKAIKAAFWLSPLLTCAVGILLVLIGSAASSATGAFAVFFAVIQSLYGCWVNPRLRYASRILSVAIAFPPTKTTLLVSLSVTASVLYSGFLATGIGGATATSTDLDILFICVILISLSWTMQVLKNVMQVTIARVRYTNFACGADMDTRIALRDTVRHMLGSVSIGSCLIPVNVVIRGSARAVNVIGGDRDEIMCSCADCYLGIANTFITWGNRWGLVHVGAYNKGFMEASRDTWELLKRAGLEQLIDVDLTGSFCFLSGIAVGALSTLAGGTWALLTHKDYALEVSIYSFFICYFLCRIAMAWPQACVSAYYVAYAENPQNPRFDSTIPSRLLELQRYSV